jgi:hypothetical protein
MSRLVIFMGSLGVFPHSSLLFILNRSALIEGQRCTCIYMSILCHIEASRIATEGSFRHITLGMAWRITPLLAVSGSCRYDAGRLSARS